MNRHLTAEQKMIRARTQLLLNHPFFGTLCVRLKLAPGSLPTMATDGRRIVYNPAFVDELKPTELEGVLAHEVLHCALAHQCRRGQREPDLWNQAADYAVNPILLGSGVVLLQVFWWMPRLPDLSAEEIYSRLLNRRNTAEAHDSESPPSRLGGAESQPRPPAGDPVNQGQRRSPPPGAIGEVMDAVGEDDQAASQADRLRQEREWAIASEQAIRNAKACGQEPGGLERALEEERCGRIDWRSVSRDFVSASRPSDYSWTPPNQRHVARGLCCRSYPQPPDYPVLWVTDSQRTADFGETLRITPEA